MTPLKPLENRRVRGVPSERYPLNEKCAHPECTDPVADPHHTFPRSQIGNDSWFVDIALEHTLEDDWHGPIPHVTGLCRPHHDLVESHAAWIKLEDGEFVWYDRFEGENYPDDGWVGLGPLNPQPGSREGKPKRRKFKGEARKARKTISIRVPNDAEEDGAGLLDEALAQLEAKLGHDPARPPYYTIMDALNYALLNIEEEEHAEED